jgi:hypothetical protein
LRIAAERRNCDDKSDNRLILQTLHSQQRLFLLKVSDPFQGANLQHFRGSPAASQEFPPLPDLSSETQRFRGFPDLAQSSTQRIVTNIRPLSPLSAPPYSAP